MPSQTHTQTHTHTYTHTHTHTHTHAHAHTHKVHDKSVTSTILWMNLNEIQEMNILQLTDKTMKPLFPHSFAGLKTRITMN